MNSRATLLFLAIMPALLLAWEVFAQESNRWRLFNTADGLAENSCVSVTVGASGNVIARHATTNVITILDGYLATIIPAPGTNQGRVYESPGGQLWTVAPDGLLEFRDGAWVLQPVPQVAEHFQSGRTNEIILQPLRQGIVIIRISGKLWRLDATDLEHARIESVAVDESTNVVVAAQLVGSPPDVLAGHKVFDVQRAGSDVTWYATSDGLFRRSPAIWESEPTAALLDSQNSPHSGAAAGFKAAIPEDILNRGPWGSILEANNDDLWLGGANAIARRHGNSWQLFSSTNQLGPENVTGFAESPDGRVWCATADKIWDFDGKNWLALHGRFDNVNGLCTAPDGRLWVATHNGVHRFVRGTWIANGVEDGLPSPVVTAIFKDDRRRILADTSQGLFVFNPDADADPPRTFILPASISQESYGEGTPVTVLFGGSDKWKLTSADRLLFSYRLDEREWSAFDELQSASFTDLPVGKHYFQVRAMDRNGNVDTKPARLEFLVALPWYKETRIVVILSAALVVALFFAGVAVNRHRQLRRSYAVVEREIAQRTSELETANRELLHSQKMTALGTVAAGIAHDFNNILSIIKGSAQIIEENQENPQKIRTRVDRIKTVVEQGSGIVNAMLGFSSAAEQPASCDLNIVASDTIKLLGDHFLREVHIHFEPANDLPAVSAVRNFVQQILLNFIFNAAEAMERRSTNRLDESDAQKTVTLVTCAVTQLPQGIVLAPFAAECFVLISVSDCGCGIPAENLPRIFEPFFTTKALSTRRGTGLGLSMAYELAKKMGAGLAVESIAGRGSAFTLIVPVQDLPTGSKTAAKKLTTDGHR